MGRLTCVARLSAEGHECLLVQRPRLVVVGLENARASHRRLGCGDDAEVFPCDS